MALGSKFTDSAWMVHEQGHCIPSRADSQRTIVDFFKKAAEGASARAVPPPAPPVEKTTEKKEKKKKEVVAVTGSAESLDAQIEEKEALEAIYDDLLCVHHVPSKVGDSTLRFTVLLSSPDLPSGRETQAGLHYASSIPGKGAAALLSRDGCQPVPV